MNLPTGCLKNHLPQVAHYALKLSQKYQADPDLAVAGAWLHDFGDAFVNRFHPNHLNITNQKAKDILNQVGYNSSEIKIILNDVLKYHSCKNNKLPQTIEGRVLATADALAHLQTDFYLQFAWMNLPKGKSFPEFIQWVNKKIDRDFNQKIFFPEEKKAITKRYQALKSVFQTHSLA